MATLRELKTRIGSVASSEKITGAMKMISSAKMHKAEMSLRRLQPFRRQVESIIGTLLTADAEFSSPLLEERPVAKVTIVVFGSDDGLCRQFAEEETDRVDCLYMGFHSVSRQRTSAEQLLPVVASTLSDNGVVADVRPCIFEPDAQTIFESVLPMFIMSVMHDVFTENRASEQAARVMAMQSANDNAKKLLEQLQLEYNKLRQQSITTELLDILGGQVR